MNLKSPKLSTTFFFGISTRFVCVMNQGNSCPCHIPCIMIDKKLRTQNYGIVESGQKDEDSKNLDYYGVLADAIELQFVMDKKVTLFRCNQSDVYDKIKEVKKSECDFVSVNPCRFSKTNDLFVLVDQASQVFYVDDTSNKGWQVVRKIQSHDSYKIVEKWMMILQSQEVLPKEKKKN